MALGAKDTRSRLTWLWVMTAMRPRKGYPFFIVFVVSPRKDLQTIPKRPGPIRCEVPTRQGRSSQRANGYGSFHSSPIDLRPSRMVLDPKEDETPNTHTQKRFEMSSGSQP